MSENTFYQAIISICEQYGGSISSMHRTVAHNRRVGGAPNSQHLGYRAADIVLDDWQRKNECITELRQMGLWVLDEVASKNHLHVDDRNNSQSPLLSA